MSLPASAYAPHDASQRLRVLGLLVGAALGFCSIDSSAAAQAESATPTAEPTPIAAPTPELAGQKRKLSARDAATKKEGTYVNGLPIVDYDPDTGLGFGAVGNLFLDGPRSDPAFYYAPYRDRIGVQVFATTAGLQQHFIDYDAPYIGGAPFRLRANIMYERNTLANYFGRGASTLRGLSFTGADRSYRTIEDYTDALRQLQPGDIAHTLYNKYDLEDPSIRATLERIFMGGFLRVLMGLSFSYVRVRDYSGHSTTAQDPTQGDDVHATEATTRLSEDCQAKRVVGCAGGLHNTLKLGIALDTRDYEPDPNSGLFIDLTGEFSSHVLGSAYEYARMTFAARGFVSPFAQFTDLVLAARVVYAAQTRGTPFFAMNTLAFTDVDRQGLGGLWTLRGYHQDRFVGPVAALANLELRWTFVQFDALSQHFALAIVPFLDVGRVFDRVSDIAFKLWRTGSGGALHIAWNDATIIDITLGASSEGVELYMDLGQQF